MKRWVEKFKRWSRSRGVRSLLLNVAIVVVVFIGVSAWQGRGLLSSGEKAPDYSLRTLDGTMTSLKDDAGRRVLLYFFAPWCKVCDASASNLMSLREWRPENDLRIYLVAVDYDNAEDVREFLGRNGITLPVLMGDDSMRSAYHVSVYPSYYVIDTDGMVRGKSTGYSTFAGLMARTFTR